MLDWSYLVTLSLLIVHQIDAAYWHEWDMFLVPGGIQFFDIFNLMIIPLLLLGLRAVVLKHKRGYYYSCGSACLGLLTCAIHSGFYGYGYSQFRLPISFIIIVLCGVSGAVQLLLTTQQHWSVDE